jgi:hypothetical protein
MANITKTVQLTLGDENVGVEYDYRQFFTSECVTTYSKYLRLTHVGNLSSYFTMEIFDDYKCAFKFYDGPYQGQWLSISGSYLYVQSAYAYVAGDFNADKTSVKLWTKQGGTKYWFKRGNQFKNDYFGKVYYITTTTNEKEALTFRIEDMSDRLGNRAPRVQKYKKAYFFKVGQYISFDVALDKADAGYPRSIKENWPGLENLSGHIDAIVDINREKLYFFSGSKYLTYDPAIGQFDAIPKPINDGNWPGLEPFASGIDAAVNAADGKIYFFKDNQYIAYDTVAGRAFPGYPILTQNGWKGVGSSFAAKIDAAVNIGNGNIYLFKGSQYVRFNIADDKAASSPQPIRGNWQGLEPFVGGIDSAIMF